MDKARETIKRVLNEADNPAVLCSFGKDSMLLLSLIRELGDTPPVIWFHSGMSREQERFARRIILDWNLHVWSWAPMDVYLLPNGKGLTLVREQSFGTDTLPGLLDVEDGQNCVLDFPVARTPRLYPHFDAYLTGWRDSDSHPVLEGFKFPPDGWTLGKGKVYAPIRHLTDNDVWKAIKELDVPVDESRYINNDPKTDDGTYFSCSRCLQEGPQENVYCPKEGKEISRVVWDRGKSLRAFRERFNLREVA